MPSGPHPRNHKPLLLIPFATLLVLHPLLIHGPSCGQDLAFHLQSWLDAAHQLRSGTLYPHWDVTAAWNAGEPRFLFYPPLSRMLGAVLTLIFPINLCPTIFIAIALLLAGFTFHKLASEFASPNAALIASTLYLANPYMLFTAFERSALAELLAAAWIPLLLLALLRKRPTVRGIAIPLALLWLTNAPAGVIGSYTLAAFVAFRLLQSVAERLPTRNRLKKDSLQQTSTDESRDPLSFTSKAFGRPDKTVPWYWWELDGSSQPPPPVLLLVAVFGAFLGLTLPALYLLPAAYQRRYVQTAMALLPNMRYQDNFLFTHTPDPAHNTVNQTISLLALTLLLLTASTVLALLLKTSRSNPPIRVPHVSLLRHGIPQTPYLAPLLALLTVLIAVLLTPLSTPIWHHLPNLAYLQFPWRLLILLTPILALSLALLLDSWRSSGAPYLDSETWVCTIPNRTLTALTLLLPLALTIPAYRLYHQTPDPTDNPAHLAQLFTTHHGFPPTDEYTPTLADNDPLRSNNPAYWLANSPNDPSPNTTPTAAELNPSLNTDDTLFPDTQTLSTPAPHHLTLNLTQPSILVLNLRDYPNWQVSTGCPHCLFFKTFARVPRNDGLIAIRVAAGHSIIDITWHRTLDQTLGLLLTILSLIALAFTFRRGTSFHR